MNPPWWGQQERKKKHKTGSKRHELERKPMEHPLCGGDHGDPLAKKPRASAAPDLELRLKRYDRCSARYLIVNKSSQTWTLLVKQFTCTLPTVYMHAHVCPTSIASCVMDEVKATN